MDILLARHTGQHKDDETTAWQNDGATRHRPGVVLNGRRTYDPWTGSYCQVDPLLSDTWSTYLYVLSDPVNKEDPEGLEIDEDRVDDYDHCPGTGPNPPPPPPGPLLPPTDTLGIPAANLGPQELLAACRDVRPGRCRNARTNLRNCVRWRCYYFYCKDPLLFGSTGRCNPTARGISIDAWQMMNRGSEPNDALSCWGTLERANCDTYEGWRPIRGFGTGYGWSTQPDGGPYPGE